MAVCPAYRCSENPQKMDWFEILKTLIGLKLVNNDPKRKFFPCGIFFGFLNLFLHGLNSLLLNANFLDRVDEHSTNIRGAALILLYFCVIGVPVILVLSNIIHWKWKCNYLENVKVLYKFLKSNDRQGVNFEEEFVKSKNRMTIYCGLIIILCIVVFPFDPQMKHLNATKILCRTCEMVYHKTIYLISITEIIVYIKNLVKCWKSLARILNSLKTKL